MVVGLVVSVWLVLLYGSWQFHDNPDPSTVTLGTSYVRYWLPLYAWWLWPAGWMLASWWPKAWGKSAVILGLLAYVALSSYLVLWEPSEGLRAIGANLRRFETVNQQITSLTRSDSVILTDITDKIFWPERNVMVSSTPAQDYAAVKTLLTAGLPVYQFHATWLPRDLAHLNQGSLAQFGLSLAPAEYGFQDFSLYRFALKKL